LAGKPARRKLSEMSGADVVAFARDPARTKEFVDEFKREFGVDPRLSPELYNARARSFAGEIGRGAGLGMAADLAESLILKALGV
jgi:hypothetical protein